MVYREEIATLILAEAVKKVPPLVAHVINFPDFNQKDVEDSVKYLIKNKHIKANYHYEYRDICTITFQPKPRL